MRRLADDILRPFRLRLGRPWGLCIYMLPFGEVANLDDALLVA